MLTTLLESQARTTRRPLGVMLSTTLHAAAIALAVSATAWTAQKPAEPQVFEHLVYTTPPVIVNRPPDATTARSPMDAVRVPVPAPVAMIPVPVDVPIGLPPMTDVQTVLAPPTFGDRFIAGGTRGDTPSGLSRDVGDGAVHTLNTVEKAVMPLPGSTSPRYPDLLRQAGVEGRVVARFVVDTLGTVERGSVDLVSASHALFGLSVRDALARARFLPAEAGGRRVRQLVEQEFSFSIAAR